jgi:hypothetical protein
MPIDLTELLAARRGLPTEPAAARTVATYTATPGAVAGIGLGLALSWNDPGDRPLWAAAGLAVVCGFGAAAGVLIGYRLLGFWAAARAADLMIGGVIGLTATGILLYLTEWGAWIAALVPAGAVVGLVVGYRADRA